MAEVALFDIDGTLVDSNYQHALAWFRAFRDHGIVLPAWRIHRHVGMGGDRLVAALAGDEVERTAGDAIRAAWEAGFDPMLGEIEPLPGANALLRAVRERGGRVALATSGKPAHVDHFVGLFGGRGLVDAMTTSEDVDVTKPAPDVVEVALDRAGGGDAVMVGDSPWDCHAAGRLGIPSIGLRSGGFGVEELTAAGAGQVFDSPAELLDHLDDTPLARR